MDTRRQNRIFVALLLLILVVGGVGYFATAGSPRYSKELWAQFEKLQGYSGDPVIRSLRDIGPEAASFLALQMQRKDSFLEDWYVALWPKLPKSLKANLSQPVSASVARVKAAGALRQMGTSFTGSEVGLAAMTSALEHPDKTLSSIAAGALGDLGPRARGAVPALVRYASGNTNINGVWALGRIGPGAKMALPMLELKMRQGSERERVYAAGAVWKIGGENAEARLVIRSALEGSDRHVQIDAQNVLAESPEIGPR